MSDCDDKLLLLQAHIDGELDAANTIALEAHLRTCPTCAHALEQLEALRAMLDSAELGHRAPDGLRARIEADLGSEGSPRVAPARPAETKRGTATGPLRPSGHGTAVVGYAGRARWGAGGFAVGLAASLALVLTMPQLTRPNTEDTLVANHIRSLSVANHLTDVATSDRHVVKPWFNGKIDFAPPVPELAKEGFPLVGGRLDYVEGHQVAALVYKRRLHTINVFVQPAATLSLPSGIAAKHDGYSLVRWTSGGLEFWAVSDINLAELQLFQRTFNSQPSL